METLGRAAVTVEGGVQGDYRGAVLPGKAGKRQITLIEAESWAAAMHELGADLAWSVRRANLLVSGIRLPREPGAIVTIGNGLRIRVTCECDPCSRMDEITPGLKLALMTDWRGGVCGRVIEPGAIALGDEVRIEE